MNDFDKSNYITWGERVVLLPELDDKATRRNARAVLNRFRSYARMAGRPLVEIKSPTIDDMPKAQAYGNSAEKRIVGIINAQVEIEKIQQAMAFLSFDNYLVLYYSYFVPEKLSNDEIAKKIKVLTDKNVDYRKRKALLQFAEAYPGQSLLVWKQN
ncbi:ArpU family phage packaging/lysis transcriptional regulator [Lapidilactobacillus gannanensis]|uniref:ArpU family phage packaging/lysis transcriptional regulator n=1 Tax=Lapidilactobacillus gannanensis TaxID=2486002 RepID=A0ABW4BPR5_9LACO|nr:ArpU family phage packaging/lysis transcriptional regulator [Lapidilactobacillus gannanensis]